MSKNVIEQIDGKAGPLSGVAIPGFDWAHDQVVAFAQSSAVGNHAVLYALFVDIFPKGPA